MTRSHRVVAVVCIAAIVFAALLPSAATLFVAVLVPLPPLFGMIVAVDAPRPERLSVEPSPSASPLPTRAPPA